MAIQSRIGKGLIYAGDTPLASTIVVEQTGPMELTVRTGSFTMIGQALFRNKADIADWRDMVTANQAEELPDGERLRIWLQDAQGNVVERSRTVVLAADQVIPLVANPAFGTSYKLSLVEEVATGTVDVLVRSAILDGVEELADLPVGWRLVHDLTFEFTVPAGAVDVSGVDIFVWRVEPGFPPGSNPHDWRMQSGRA